MNFVYNVQLQQLKWVSKPLISTSVKKNWSVDLFNVEDDFDLVVEFGKKFSMIDGLTWSVLRSSVTICQWREEHAVMFVWKTKQYMHLNIHFTSTLISELIHHFYFGFSINRNGYGSTAACSWSALHFWTDTPFLNWSHFLRHCQRRQGAPSLEQRIRQRTCNGAGGG